MFIHAERANKYFVGVQTACAHLGNRLWLLLLGFWVALVIYGSTKLELYAATPGQHATGLSSVAGKRFHLYVFLHPLCACSTASIDELNRLQDRAGAQLDMTAVIDNAGFLPKTAQLLVSTLTATPGLAVEVDADGKKSASYGARTSGQVLLFDTAGTLVFSGGVTSARAHEGDNIGETAILDIVRGRVPTTHETPSFGCALSPPTLTR